MATYKVLRGQNIYDVAVSLYGSIEGINRLMFLNPDLGLSTDLKAGDEIIYDDNAAIYGTIVDDLRQRKITPVNGERTVYYKKVSQTKRMVIMLEQTAELIAFLASGTGVVSVDWGDNSDIEKILLHTGEPAPIKHYFDNETTSARIITLYGDFSFQCLDLSNLNAEAYILNAFQIDKVIYSGGAVGTQFLPLARGIYEVRISHRGISDLSDLNDLDLQNLTLAHNVYRSQSVIDKYLIHIATHYGVRRHCVVEMDIAPSGEYQEPPRDEHGNYVITTGMQAVYVITHEPDWNIAGAWTFKINNSVYKYEL